MSTFDPELYLRLLGERWLLAGASPNRGGGPVASAGAALVAAGLISGQQARTVGTDYEDAAGARDPDAPGAGFRSQHFPAGTGATAALAPRSMFAADVSVSSPDWTVDLRWVARSSGGVKIGGTGTMVGEMTGNRHVSPPSLDIRLSDGSRRQVHYQGGWGSGANGLRGAYDIGDVPDAVGWIDVEGQRVDLTHPLTTAPATIEALEPAAPATRYLWQLLSDFGDRHANHGIEDALSALDAAGVLAEDDPELEAVRWVADTGGIHGSGMAMRALRGYPGASAGLAQGQVPAGLPAAWRSLFTAPHFAGPTGTLRIGAATPLFDGISLAVNVLDSNPDRWLLEVEAVGLPHPHPFASALERRPLAWWAWDDRANWYLGSMNGWSGGGPDEHSEGQISFAPLDPKATTLTLAPTAATARALIPVALEWS